VAEVNPVTWRREYVVFGTTSDGAVTAAKVRAKADGLRVLTVAKVRADGDGGWTVTLAVRGQEAEGV
jgi:hypothetical protein